MSDQQLKLDRLSTFLHLLLLMPSITTALLSAFPFSALTLLA